MTSSSSQLSPRTLLHCGKCGGALPLTAFNTGTLVACPDCQTCHQGYVFPAILNQFEVQAGEQVQQEEEAACFYHPAKKAVTVCEGCGVFLCGLCDIVLHEQHLCPRCIEKGKARGKIRNLENQRVLYDDMALGLAILPLLIFWLTILTAPIALFIAIRHWNSPRSLIPRGKLRFIFAIVLALLEIVGWVFLITRIVQHH